MQATLASRAVPLARIARSKAFRPALVPAAAGSLRRGRQQSITVRASSQQDADIGAAGYAAIALGLPANGIVFWSLFTKWSTGAGLQGDVLGGIEGLSYLVVLGVFAWSVQTKLSTGSGLPAGPGGALGAVEGVTFLSVLAAALVFGLKAAGI